MNSKTSFCNKSLIKADFKRFWWISALYAVLIFLTATLPFVYKVMHSNMLLTESDNRFIFSYLYGNSAGYYVLAVIMPVLLGVMLFSYLQSGKASTFTHSLPVTRGEQFVSHLLSGIVMIVLPLIINGVILMLFKINDQVAESYRVSHLVILLFEAFLYSLLTFSAACFISAIAGNTVASFIFTYVLGLIPAAAELFINFFIETQLYGYSYNGNYSITKFLYIEPGKLHQWKNVLLYIVIAAVFVAAAYLLYKIRNLENHSEVVAFPKLRPVFVYGAGICCGCFGFAYFNALFETKNALLLIPLGVLGIVIAQMIVKKSFRVPQVYKPVLIYSAIVIVIFGAFYFDISGYERRIPDAADVEYVTFWRNSTPSSYNTSYSDASHEQIFLKHSFSPDIKDKKLIEDVITLHEYLVQSRNDKETDSENLRDIYLTYQLNNGRTINRHYIVDMEAQKGLLENIIESKPVRESYFSILQDNEMSLEKVSVSDRRLGYTDFAVFYPSDEKMNILVEALKKDLSSIDYDDYAEYDEYMSWYDTFTTVTVSGYLPCVYADGSDVPQSDWMSEYSQYSVLPSFTNTIKVLRDIGLYDYLPSSDDVSSISVDYHSNGTNNDIIVGPESYWEVLDFMESNPLQKDTDASVMVELKNGYSYEWSYNRSGDNVPDVLK